MSERTAPRTHGSDGAAGVPAWCGDFFDDLFADAILDGSGAEEASRVAATVELLVATLDLRAGARVLDQGCGTGRLAVPLARRGISVVAVDSSPGYVARARAAVEREGLPVELHAADATRFVPRVPCDAAFNWYTSFGFSDDDTVNGAMLARAHDALRPGGRFALDYANVPGLLERFQPTMRVERALPEGRGAVALVRESRLDATRGMLEQRWIWRLPDGSVRERRGGTRLYTPTDLTRMLRAAGFRDVELHDETARGPVTIASARCVALATR